MFRFNHLSLVVPNPDAAAVFYKRHLMPAGNTAWLGNTLRVRDTTGSDIAFQEGVADIRSSGAHHGFLAADAASVDALRDRLVKESVTITDDFAEEGLRSIKFLDPFGYECEVYWEQNWPG